ncbi:hypothetical protein [Actinacidiphila acididurans]|uniref:PRTRC system protein E n=1 Tax=Actinacidiphila acididurans TaxID=2784346 RepID=A0ABS2U5L7_9ACTN|nr:hypothetical protein [Actinacidiphila acididurans]MBM9510011.1 hypothetical protein [Actinacidiphila acididurans]
MNITLDLESGPVEIRIHRSDSHVSIFAMRGNYQLGMATDAIQPINDFLRKSLGDKGADCTHHIGTALLTPEHVAQINAAIAQTTVEPLGLAGQRAALASNLENIRDTMTAAQNAAADSEDGLDSYYLSGQAERDEAREEAAETALAAFDQAHPEILEQQAAERRAAHNEALERALFRD